MPDLSIDSALREYVSRVVETTPILDIHTHIYQSSFGDLLLWGIDELLTYHYLIAEVFRAAPMPYEKFWAMSKTAQADYIWDELFIKRSPVSEATRGVLTVLARLGLDVGARDLKAYREYFASMSVDEYIDKVFEVANVRGVIMTNDPFDDKERPGWLEGAARDERFQAALRIDPLLMDWENSAKRLQEWGYSPDGKLGQKDFDEIRKFLGDWIERMQPKYMAVSLPPTFRYPDETPCAKIIENCILPVAKQAGIPFAMMIGVKKLINPDLQLAGDGVGKSDINSVEYLCRENPDNRFLVTFLSRENQHEHCIAARKFGNMHVFGCWWYMNNPSIIEEITRERFELLGLTFTPQHSDARVLDQLIYKWTHSRQIIADVLADKYADIIANGWQPTEAEIRRDVEAIFGGTFERFLENVPQG